MLDSNTKLKDKLHTLPIQPGVYLFKNKDGEVIYVGKAKSLRTRVRQYFGQDNRPQIPFLIEEARDIDFIVSNSELESIFLENTIIKQYLPRYNIMLKDDKNYAFIQIDYSTEIPSIGIARKVERVGIARKVERGGKNKYFGPYSSALKIRRTLEVVRRIFTYCANTQKGKRPCFYYFLHRCPGICAGTMTPEDYTRHLKRIELFLSGKTTGLKKELRLTMKKASSAKKYEVAAKIRDQIHAIELLEEKQSVQFPKRVNWDFISLYTQAPNTCVNLFKVREGKLQDKEDFIYTNTSSKDNVLQTFLEGYYSDTSDIPREIYIEHNISDTEIVRKLLFNRAKHKVNLKVPSKGKKLELIKLGKLNAEEYLKKWENTNALHQDRLKTALEELQKILKLPTFPHRIEGYDISNIQGTNPVGSMVVAKDGSSAKSEYKKFKIQIKETPDDFAMMKEMLTRRLLHLEGQGTSDKQVWETPDLIVIDGGKGQLGVAARVLKEYKLNIPVIGLAKRIEEIFIPGKSKAIVLPHDSPTLHILQRLRDEAHRFAITFHRSLRSKQAVNSELDFILGIGPVAKRKLKKHFGTLKKIREASFEEIARVIGDHQAKILKRHI